MLTTYQFHEAALICLDDAERFLCSAIRTHSMRRIFANATLRRAEIALGLFTASRERLRDRAPAEQTEEDFR